MVVEEQDDNSSSILRTNYVRISELEDPETSLQKDRSCPPNIELDDKHKKSADNPEPKLLNPKILQTPDPNLGQGSDINPPTQT